MRAMDVMTTNVITVTPDTAIQDLAALLANHGISGAPVLDPSGRLVGLVSEGDLLHRTETGTERRTERRRTRWLDSFSADRDQARDYVRSHGRFVRDVMTRDVITVSETTQLDEIADLMETKRIKRVPVVRGDTVVGIVSRANLVRALVAQPGQKTVDATEDDSSIRRAILSDLQKHDWANKVWAADVIVKGGIVHLWCSDDRSDDERRALRVAAENTPGVRGVEEHLVSVPMAPPF